MSIDNIFEQSLNRRDFLKTLSLGLCSLTIPSILQALVPEEADASPRKLRAFVSRTDYSRIPVPDIGYTQILKEPNLLAVELASNDTHIGRVQRALRWRNITRAIEKRYGIPRDYLFGMICVESEGDPTQPNQLGDGGLGLCHMQPYMANKYGLKLISDSKRLRDRHQGRLINKAIELHNGDLKDLIEYDDRFHPIKNLDAAGRMICDHYRKTRSWSRSLERYAGRRTYDDKVISYANKIHSSRFMSRVSQDFNGRNDDLLIGGNPINFERYRTIFGNLNRNYGLDEYLNLRRHPAIVYR